MTTRNQILTVIYNLILTTPITLLDGGVYKMTRPTGSKSEDCVIGVISGVLGKFLQDGTIYIKLFYKDILHSNTYTEDTINGAIKEQLLYDLSEEMFKLPSLCFYKDLREIITEAVPENHEHCAILKMTFKI